MRNKEGNDRGKIDVEDTDYGGNIPKIDIRNKCKKIKK